MIKLDEGCGEGVYSFQKKAFHDNLMFPLLALQRVDLHHSAGCIGVFALSL